MIITEKYENFIWDFDGTLFDSYPHTAQALALALKDSGREIDIKEAEKLLRITVGTDEEMQTLVDAIKEIIKNG